MKSSYMHNTIWIIVGALSIALWWGVAATIGTLWLARWIAVEFTNAAANFLLGDQDMQGTS